MFITRCLLAKKTKTKHIMVLMESYASGHQYNQVRERAADKVEIVRWDPYIQQMALYTERKKIFSIKKNVVNINQSCLGNL